MTQAATLVELGSGSSEKTRLLLDALRGGGQLAALHAVRRLPAARCADAAAALRARLSGHRRPRRGRRLPRARALSAARRRSGDRCWSRFWAARSATSTRRSGRGSSPRCRLVLRPGDWFLLGADLVKAKRRLDAAYNDAAGVTVQFNKNVLRVLEPRSARDVRRRAVRPRRRLRSRARAGRHPPARARRARGEGPRARADRPFTAGEEMRTEISVKFTRPGLETIARGRRVRQGPVLDRPRQGLLAVALAGALA